MNYFSYIDNFNLNLDDLDNLPHTKLAKIIESLNINTKQPFPEVINGLTDSDIRQHHFIIESNLWLKAILLDDFENIKQNDIQLNTNLIKNEAVFRNFLEPYLYPKISTLIQYLIDKEAYITLFRILALQQLYSLKVNSRIISILKATLKHASKHIEDGLLCNSLETINYVKNLHFFNSLNLFKNAFDKEIPKLYHTLLEVHDQFKTNSTDDRFKFTAQALVAFGNSKLDNIGTKLLIDDNANTAKTYAFINSRETVKDTNNDVLKTFGIITFILASAMVYQFYALTSNQNSVNNTHETTLTISPNDIKKKRTNYDNRIRFYYSLKRKIIKSKPSNNKVSERITPFENPYPSTFNLLPNSSYETKNINTLLKNNTEHDLIVFRLVKGKDQSLYIPKNSNTYIGLKENDSLLFYYGKEFVTSKLAHFNTTPAISEIYKIIKRPKQLNPQITINPSAPNSNIKSIENGAIIASEGFNLKKMNLNNLYTKYYTLYSN